MNQEAGPQQTGENAPHILTLHFWNSEKRISVVYKPLVYGVLLQEPKEMRASITNFSYTCTSLFLMELMLYLIFLT